MVKRAFTLIELLVVVAIIAVLLSLLMPAMDKAVYRAELLQCAGRLRVLGSAVTQYAFDNKRYYPDRDMGRRKQGDTGASFTATNVYSPLPKLDLRPALRPLVNINKTMQCQFPGTIELDNRPPEQQDIVLESSYTLWWGWQYKYDNQTFAGMFRMGDRFSSHDFAPGTGSEPRLFSVLAGDMDGSYQQASYTAHPDRDGLLAIQVNDPGVFIGRFASSWYRIGPKERGVVDNNYVFSDNSVRLYTDVPHMNIRDRNRDHPQMARVPNNFDGTNNQNGYTSHKYHIPRD